MLHFMLSQMFKMRIVTKKSKEGESLNTTVDLAFQDKRTKRLTQGSKTRIRKEPWKRKRKNSTRKLER
jgi:hypothetical protein